MWSESERVVTEEARKLEWKDSQELKWVICMASVHVKDSESIQMNEWKGMPANNYRRLCKKA